MLESNRERFVFNQIDKKFILDPETQMFWSLSIESDDDLVRLENNYDVLSKYGFFNKNNQTEHQQSFSQFDLTYLVINPSTKCNLDCWYCYSSKHRKENNEQLDLENVKSIIRDALEFKTQSQSNSPLSISMFFTSEITLEFNFFHNIWDFIRDIKADFDFPIYTFLPPTNLMDINKDFVEFIEEYGYLTVSLDLHNEKQMEMVFLNLKQFTKGVKKHCIIPLNSSNVEFLKIYAKLLEHFDCISTRPVRISKDSKYPWTPESLELFSKEMQSFVCKLLELNADELLQMLLAFGPSDYFVRYFDRVISRTKYIERCPAGKTAAAINPDYKLYPCSGLNENDQYSFSSFDEMSKRESNYILTENVQSKSKCKECPIRYYCGGPCEDWKSKLKLSSIESVNHIECAINMIYFKNAIYLISKLHERNPKLLVEYAKEKGIKYRLSYPLNFEDFVLFFS